MKGGKGLSLLIGIGKPKGGPDSEQEQDDKESPPDLELEGQAVLKAIKAGDAKGLAQALREFIDAHHDAPVMGDDDDADDEQDK